jgi:hypothetical protein
MKWIDPAAMSDSEIEAELRDVALKLAEVREGGGKIAELEGRQWRLRFEQRFHRGDSHDTR